MYGRRGPMLRKWAFGSADAPDNIADIPGVEDAPTQALVNEHVDELEGYVPDLPMDWTDLDPAAAQQWAEESIRNWAAQNGVPLDEDEIREAAIGWAEEQIGMQVPTNVRDARNMGIEVAVTEACSAAGVDVRVGVVTYEALRDGDFDEEDCQAIGQTAGAYAGAAIGQAYGIPAPIGAYVGGMIGGTIGSWFSESFGIGTTADDRRREEIEARKEAIQDWYVEMQSKCLQLKGQVRGNHQSYVNTLIELWTQLELDIGLRFQLRWFGVRRDFGTDWRFTHYQPPSVCFRSSAGGSKYYGSEQFCESAEARPCYVEPAGCTLHGVACREQTTYTQIDGEKGYYQWLNCWCDVDYGCQYPFTDYVGNREIVSKVWSAIGKPWSTSQCNLEAPDVDWYARSGGDMVAWQNRVIAQINSNVTFNRELRVKYDQVLCDLLRTAAIVKAEKEVAYQKLELAHGGTKTLAEAAAMGRRKSLIVNGGLMLAGLALLWHVWRKGGRR